MLSFDIQNFMLVLFSFSKFCESYLLTRRKGTLEVKNYLAFLETMKILKELFSLFSEVFYLLSIIMTHLKKIVFSLLTNKTNTCFTK